MKIIAGAYTKYPDDLDMVIVLELVCLDNGTKDMRWELPE